MSQSLHVTNANVDSVAGESHVHSIAYLCTCHVSCSANLTSRDLLRRHMLLHEEPTPRAAISCDACRANKTKCSGGPPCSLCTRRGVNCTFRGRRRAQRLLNQDRSGTSHTPSSQDEEDGPSPHIATSSLSKALSKASTELPRSVEKEDLPANPKDFLRNLTIIPTQRERRRDIQPVGAGMETVYEALLAGSSSLNEILQGSRELRAWVADSSATYLREFHVRWPALHAPTFDIEHDSLPLTATICMIGAWFRGPTISIDRFYVLRTHEFLLQRFLQDIV